MRVFSTVMKIVVALAAVAGAIYVAATYGDKIVAWCKKMLNSCPCCCGGECDCEGECECDCDCDCQCANEEVQVEVVPAAEEAPAVEEADFEG